MIGRHHLTLVTAIGLVGCAGASQTSGKRPCAISPADSVFLSRGAVYPACAVEQRVQVVVRRQPEFRPDMTFSEECYSAEFEFVVDETGTPEVEEARRLHANSPSFADAALAALAQWRYKPATLNGVPVRQITTERFGLAAVRVLVPAGGIPRPPDRFPKC